MTGTHRYEQKGSSTSVWSSPIGNVIKLSKICDDPVRDKAAKVAKDSQVSQALE